MNQNIDGLKSETICAFTKLGEFLVKLKELGIYDDSMIVFKSDHGHPTNYFTEYPYNLEINKHKLWGYSRYRPLLMIKSAHTRRKKLYRQQDLALLGDLANTICRNSIEVDSISNCELFPGIDLVAADGGDSEYFLYIVPTPASSFTFDAHVSIPIDTRRNDPVDALSLTDGVALEERGTEPD
jgi:hypothetical protein